MTRPFVEDDVVVLKSGGPRMTVLQFEEDFDFVPELDDELPGVMCVWFGGGETADDLQMKAFDECVLVKYVGYHEKSANAEDVK